MDSLPTELITAFGQYLDGPSLSSSLRVCRFWFHALTPLIWSHISRTQWHRPGFPIRQVFDTYDDSSFRPKLLQIRHLEWAANCDLKDVNTITIRKEIARPRLIQLLGMAVNIRSLELRMPITLDELEILQSFTQLRRLKRLRIEATGLDMFAINLQDMSNIFARLETLESEGFWLNISMDSWEQSQDVESWQLKRLSIGYYALPMLWHCVHLRELEIRIYEDFGFLRSGKVSLRPLQTCRNLEILKIHRYNRQDMLVDLVETIGTLRELRSLSFGILDFSFFELLCRSRENLDLEVKDVNNLKDFTGIGQDKYSRDHREKPPDGFDDGNALLPKLESLTIISVDVGDHAPSINGRISNLFFDILKTRPLLKEYQIQGFNFCLWDIFAQPGHEIKDSWACLGLEVLKLQFKNADPPKSKSNEKRRKLWQSIYRQLGQLTRLKSLMIQCWSLEKGNNSGILQLAQQAMSVDSDTSPRFTPKLAKLCSLYLSDLKGSTWTKAELETLLTLFPKLKDLNLRPLNPGNGKEVQMWLKEWKRADIKFV
ncbi:hypothetical protein FBU30_008043 [Linnemannia zychae]|nr:hypothetical protein FBU30_008043 [Linnemannia zychae]